MKKLRKYILPLISASIVFAASCDDNNGNHDADNSNKCTENTIRYKSGADNIVEKYTNGKFEEITCDGERTCAEPSEQADKTDAAK